MEPEPAAPPAAPAPPARSRLRRLAPALAGGAVLLLAAAGGIAYVIERNADPVPRAERAEAQGDLRAALLQWRNAIARDPRNPAPHLRLADVQFRLFDTFGAEKELRAAGALGADTRDVYLRLGRVYVAQNRWRAVLNEMPRTAPTPAQTVQFLMLRAIAQLATNDFEAALATLEAARAASPASMETALIAARVALAQGENAEAERQVDAALKLSPDRTDALLIKLQLVAARDEAEALRLADRAVASAPYDPPPRLDRANHLMTAGQDEKARADVDFVLSRFPNLTGALYLDALLLARAGRYKDSWLAFEKVTPFVEAFPRALYVQALVALNLGNVETALELARRYAVRMPGDPDGVRLLARTQIVARRPDLAAPVLERAVASGQADAETLDLLGTAYASMGEDAAALRVRRRAAELAPADAEILANLGQLQVRLGNAGAAAGMLAQAARLDPSLPASDEALVEAALLDRDPARAQTALDALRRKEGATERVARYAGAVLMARNDPEAARAAYAAAVKAFPQSAAAKIDLARAAILSGTPADGEAILREVLAKDPADMQALAVELQLRMQNRQFPQAVAAVEKARAAAPADPLLTAMVADLLIRAGEPGRALSVMEARRAQGDMTAVLLGALARAQRANGQYDAAIASYGQQLKASPGDAEARPALVDLLMRSGKAEQARAALQEGLAQAPGTYGLLSSLVAMEAKANGTDAALAMAAGFRRNPANMPAAALLRGDVLMQARQFQQAAGAWQAEFAQTPLPALASRIAGAYMAAGDDERAAEVLRGWLAGHAGDPDAAQMLSRLDLRAQRWDAAQRNLELVLAARPDDTLSLNNLAWLYQSRGDPRARDLARRAFLRNPNPRIADTFGWILAQQGDSKAAVSILEPAWRQAQSDPTLTYHLAVAYKGDGKPDWALQLLRPLIERKDAFADRTAAETLVRELSQ